MSPKSLPKSILKRAQSCNFTLDDVITENGENSSKYESAFPFDEGSNFDLEEEKKRLKSLDLDLPVKMDTLQSLECLCLPGFYFLFVAINILFQYS